MSLFARLIRKSLNSGNLVIQFSPINEPKYIPQHQSDRADKKAIIQFPCEVQRTVLAEDSDQEIEKVAQSVVLDNALILFSHEFGHHLTKNPNYDEALTRCLKLPVVRRSFDDILLVLQEETEAWSKGFSALEELGFEIPENAKKLAHQCIFGYSKGILLTEPKRQ